MPLVIPMISQPHRGFLYVQSVPQGSIEAQDAENRRIEAIANELRRRCELYEVQRGVSQPHVSSFEIEQRTVEAFAKENGLWLGHLYSCLI